MGTSLDMDGPSPGLSRSSPLEQGAERRPAAGSSRAADIIDDDIPF